MLRDWLFPLFLLFFLSLSPTAGAQEGTPQGVPIKIPFKNFSEMVASGSGMVGIPYETYKKMVETIENFHREKIPQQLEGYALLESSYTGRVSDQGVEFAASLTYLLKGKKFKKIPLFHADVSITSLRDGSGKQLSLVPPPSGDLPYSYVTDGSGTLKLDIHFFVDVRKTFPQGFQFKIPLSPISRFDLTHTNPKMEFDCPQARKVASVKGDHRYRAFLVPTSVVEVQFQEAAVAGEAEETEEKSTVSTGRVYLDVLSYGLLTDGLAQVTARAFFEIHQGEVDHLSLDIPREALVLDVEAKSKIQWKVREEDNKPNKTIEIRLLGRMTGKLDLLVKYEQAFDLKGKSLAFPLLVNRDYIRNSGFVALAARDTVELIPLEPREVKSIEPGEFAARWTDPAPVPVTLAYSYTTPDAALGIRYQRHEEVSVITTTIDSCNAQTIITRGGQIVTQLVYLVRNSNQQFLQTRLPEGGNLWSVRVNGTPAKPGMNSEGMLQIPLIKSRPSGQNLEPFPVEITFETPMSELLPGIGGQKLHLPLVLLRISTMEWRVYIPEDYKWLSFKGNVLPSRRLHSFVLKSAGGQYAPRNLESSVYDNLEQGEAKQLAAILDHVKTLGISAVNIELPTTRNFYQFHKDLIESSQAPPFLEIRYCGRPIYLSLKFLLFATGFCWVFLQAFSSRNPLRPFLALLTILLSGAAAFFVGELQFNPEYILHGLFFGLLLGLLNLLGRAGQWLEKRAANPSGVPSNT